MYFDLEKNQMNIWQYVFIFKSSYIYWITEKWIEKSKSLKVPHKHNVMTWLYCILYENIRDTHGCLSNIQTDGVS